MDEKGRPEDWPQFDEGFVAGAVYREPDAGQRRREQERQAAKERADRLRAREAASIDLGRRRQRRQRRSQLLPRHAWKVLAVAGVVAIAVVAYNKLGGGHPSQPSTISNATPTVPAAPASSVPETSTSLQLQERDFQSGACVLWDQTAATNGPWGVPTQVVGCSRPHLVEIVGTVQQIAGFGQSWPGEAAIAAYTDQHCAAPTRSFLGYDLDTYGRFATGAIHPTPDGWLQGDRSYYCDIQMNGGPSPGKLTLFSGEAKGADQELLDPIGSCLKVGSATPVPCSGAHQLELTGDVAIPPGTTRMPATEQEWQTLVGSRCSTVSLNYVGGTYPSGYQTSWLLLEASSWAAGERTVQCTIGRPDFAAGTSSWATTTGSVRR